MSKINVEELRKQAKELVESNLVKIKEAAEIGKLTAMIALNSNSTLLDAKAKLMITEEDTKKLGNLINECSEIISSTPVINKKTRSNRKWAGQHRYGFGNQIDQMYEIATGLIYSCQEHKDILLAHTGLNIELLTQFVEAFGNPTYYSVNNNVVIPEVPANLAEVKSTLLMLQVELDVIINTSKLTANNLELESVTAETKASKDFALSEEAINEADLEL
jgi:hypothetical protein